MGSIGKAQAANWSGQREDRRSARMASRIVVLLALLVMSVSLEATASSALPLEAGVATSHGAIAARPRPPAHVVVIVMENKDYGQVIGSGQAPYLTALANKKVLLTKYYAIRHPSLPNYLTLVGGNTFGVTDDCPTGTCYVAAANLGSQLSAKGISWKAYMETMPHRCYAGVSAGSSHFTYVKKHDPFMYFNNIRKHPKLCNRVVPFGAFPRDLRSGLPRFAWITPNECNDMHSCPVSDGDAWLKRWIPRILPKLGSNGILIVTFDEDHSSTGCCRWAQGGNVATVIAGPGAANHRQIRAAADHYSLLRLIEDAFHLRRLGYAARKATPTIKGWRR